MSSATLNATRLDKIMKKVFKTWELGYYFERLAQFKVRERKSIKELPRGMRMKPCLIFKQEKFFKATE